MSSKGLRFKVHGNYCGPGWTAGEWKDSTDPSVDWSVKPVDRADAACKKHDLDCSTGKCSAKSNIEVAAKLGTAFLTGQSTPVFHLEPSDNKRGVVVARNKDGETRDEAIARVKRDHPNKTVVFENPDTPPYAEPVWSLRTTQEKRVEEETSEPEVPGFPKPKPEPVTPEEDAEDISEPVPPRDPSLECPPRPGMLVVPAWTPKRGNFCHYYPSPYPEPAPEETSTSVVEDTVDEPVEDRERQEEQRERPEQDQPGYGDRYDDERGNPYDDPYDHMIDYIHDRAGLYR